jgi:glycosyltransferase involved in cell wall biosynthesis
MKSVLLEWFPFNPWIVWPLVVLFLVFALQLYFYGGPFAGISRVARKFRKGQLPVTNEQPPVSIIVCAQDKADDLLKHLPFLLDQDYPDYQVVVVNAASSDHTEDVLQSFESNSRLYHTFLPVGVKGVSPRKMAMTIGIKAAKYDYVLFTDPEATPSSRLWLAAMMRQFTQGGDVVLGYAPFNREPGMAGRMVAYDNVCAAMQYLGLALNGLAYRAHSANLAFRKELFFSNKGFASHLFLRSGDDDLLIREIATPTNVRVEISPESLVSLENESVWRTWKEQLINHFTTASRYKAGVRLLLFLEGCSRTVFYLLLTYLILLTVMTTYWAWLCVTVGLFLFRWVVQAVVTVKAASNLGERVNWLFVPLLDIILPFIKAFIRLASRAGRGNAYTWEVLR